MRWHTPMRAPYPTQHSSRQQESDCTTLLRRAASETRPARPDHARNDGAGREWSGAIWRCRPGGDQVPVCWKPNDPGSARGSGTAAGRPNGADCRPRSAQTGSTRACSARRGASARRTVAAIWTAASRVSSGGFGASWPSGWGRILKFGQHSIAVIRRCCVVPWTLLTSAWRFTPMQEPNKCLRRGPRRSPRNAESQEKRS